MPENLALSLQITLIGMSLVFAAIVFLWVVMDVLMRLTNLKLGKKDAIKEDLAELQLQERKRKAAAVAVVLALAQQNETGIYEFPLPPTAVVSPWQAVMRANNLSKRGPVR